MPAKPAVTEAGEGVERQGFAPEHGGRVHRQRRRERPADEPRARLIERLRSEQPALTAAVLARVRSVPAPAGRKDAEYQAGMQRAVEDIVERSLTVFERGVRASGPAAPRVAIEQARRLAGSGVGAETLVQAVLAGHRVLGRLVSEAAAALGLPDHADAMDQLRVAQEELLEPLTASLAAEHADEMERVARSSEQRRLERVRRLLAGEPVETSALSYQLTGVWHLGVIAVGGETKSALGRVSSRLGLQLLAVSSSDRTAWGWWGSQRELPLEAIEELLQGGSDEATSFTLGLPSYGLEGWRMTHEQAEAALAVSLLQGQRLTRCADVACEAALLQNRALTGVLLESYLAPLDRLRMGGAIARETVQSYLVCERNLSSAARRLGATRQTVAKRLRAVEDALGRPLSLCAAEVELALRLEALVGTQP